ncbi:MAG: hydantoinase/oxoprolinase family protein [Solirubrobacterales bacterium]
MSSLLGIDVGGTFTDVVLFDESDGSLTIDKVPSTPTDPSQAVINGITKLRDQRGIDVSALTLFAHGSTVATNALLEMKLPRVALLVTRGFRDVLEIGDQMRSNMFDLTLRKASPAVPRDLVIEVDERLDRLGSPVTELSYAEIERVCDQVAALELDACGICFLFSFQNAAHERALATALKERLPDLHVGISADICPEIKEYPRASTTVISAALQPLVANYIHGIERGLEAEKVGGQFFVMQSSGGVMSAEEAAHNAHRMILSGPAAGVIAASRLAEADPAYRNQITLDMGGTSTDICLIHDGRPRSGEETVFDGRPIKVPQIDIHTIGSGGGSIAHIDPAGLLHVGPQSAGATPGPACYGHGGTEATVTDAHVVLGRIDPGSILGGEMRIDADAARSVIERRVATPLGLSIEEAAAGILEVSDAQIARGIRVVSVNRGHDPRDFSIVAFGGAGALHALTAAALVDVGTVVVPTVPGAFSALGLVNADVKHHLSRTVEKPVGQLSPGDLEATYAKLIDTGRERLAKIGANSLNEQFVRMARMRYTWQDNTVQVIVGEEAVDEASLAAALSSFHAAHDREFGHSNAADPVEIVSVSVEALGSLPRPRLEAASLDGGPGAPPESRRRKVFFRGEGWMDVPILAREALAPGIELAGPAIVEEREATTLVTPGANLRVDPFGNLVLTQEGDS